MNHKIINIQKLFTPFGNGLEQVQLVFDCNLFDLTSGVIGKRYTSKGNFIPINADKDRVALSIKEEIVYIKHFLLALGFDCEHITQSINEFIYNE